jgi:two-component sensor histidine kinase
VNNNIGIDEFISITKSRIITLSKIHEQLYLKDNFYQLDANEYVKELAENVKITFLDIPTEIEFQFSNEVVILDLETLIPLGLIINELLLNSYKHAFPQRQEGIIEIKVLLFEKNKYQLIYSDNGVGLQEANTNQKSIGMNLINALCKQLRSEPDFHFEGGSHFEIIFKKIKYKN